MDISKFTTMKYMNVSLTYTLKSLKTSHSSFIMQYMTALYSELQLVLALLMADT